MKDRTPSPRLNVNPRCFAISLQRAIFASRMSGDRAAAQLGPVAPLQFCANAAVDPNNPNVKTATTNIRI
jgi:hypothetical protein